MATNEQNQSAPEKQNGNLAVAVPEKTIADSVLNKIKIFEETGMINIPKAYSAPNALRVAWLILQETKDVNKRPVLEVCTKESIANSLLRMVILGLNPAKRQCSFIAYGNQLTCQREYQGTVAIAKRHGVVDVSGCAVFKGDVFEYVIDPATGNKSVTKHEQKIENIDTGVVIAAYATKKYEDGRTVTEVMSMSQIRKAWEQGAMKGQSPAHKNFPDEMAIKTVKNRLLKPDVNSSDDGDLFDDEDELRDDVKMANVKHRIAENANRTELSMDKTEDAEAELLDTKNVDTQTGEVRQPELELQNGPGF